MARSRPRSSIEGRLVAVLSGSQRRRGVSLALAAVALAVAAGVAVPVAMLRAADQKPAAATQSAAQPKDAVKLKTAVDEQLKWGEPQNGLRAAVVFRAAAAAPEAAKGSELPEVYIAVQNTSNAPIRLNDTLAEEQPRMLYFKSDGRTQAGVGAKEPRLGDVTLQPREVSYVRMYSGNTKAADGHTVGQLIAEGTLKDTHQSLVAELLIEKAPPGAWTGKLRTGETTGAVAAGQPQPTDKSAQALLALWQHHARQNGEFPGGLVGRLGERMKEFIKNNTGDASGEPCAKKMSPLLPRIDASRDWTAAQVVALMDDIAAVTPVPLEMMSDEISGLTFRGGAPLPKDLADAPWGPPAQPSGLRLAWLLEPRAAEHPLGTPLKSRILVHNAGKNVVVFRARTWHQGAHTARDAKGAEIHVEATTWLTRPPLVPFRLWPGEFVELRGTGIGVGTMKEVADSRTGVGSWVEAKTGDEVTITTAPVPLSDWNEAPDHGAPPRWWLELIKEHLPWDTPLPADAQERSRLVYRAGMELFGTPLSAQEIAAFVDDRGPDALESLAGRLAKRADITPFAGGLSSGPTKFRVLPFDPEAAKKSPSVPTGGPPASAPPAAPATPR
jgi:hypothetical protein